MPPVKKTTKKVSKAAPAVKVAKRAAPVKAAAPIKRVAAPVKKVATIKRVTAPAKKVAAPIKRVAAPAKPVAPLVTRTARATKAPQQPKVVERVVIREVSPDTNVIRKPILKGFKTVRAAHMKPAEARQDEDGEFTFSALYVTPRGKQERLPCSAAMYKKINGSEPKKGQRHKGLDMQVRLQFLLGISKSDKTLQHIHIVPENDAMHGMVPADLEGRENLEGTINTRTGEIQVTLMPAKVSNSTVDAIVLGLDKLEEVRVGDLVADKYPIVFISGNVFHISPSSGTDESYVK